MLNRNPRLVGIQFFACMAVLVLSPLARSAEGLPLDAKKVVETFDKETAAIRKKGDDRTTAAQDKLLKKLRELQVEQTKAGMLDEAVLIRDSVRAIEADKKMARLSKFDLNVVTKLPAEAQVAIGEYDESVGGVSKQVAEELNGKQTAFNARLKELLATYTKEGKLDEALAIRSRISSSPVVAETIGVTNLGTTINLGSAGASFATVEARYREQIAVRTNANRKVHKQAADALVLKLAPILTAHTKAGRLEPALAVRNLSQSLVAEQDPYKLVAVARSQRDKLPADAAALADEFLKDATQLQEQSAESFAKLSLEFAPHVEVEARKQLLAGNLEPARQLLAQLYSFRKQEFPFAWAGHYRQTPVLSDKAQPFFERLETAKAERLAKANAEQEPLRKKLVESLQAALDQKPQADAAEALEQTIELLGAESTEGVRGILLFVADKRLPAASLAAVKEFRAAVKKLILELSTRNAESAKQLAADLGPIREAHVMAGELEAAFIILERQQNTHRSFEPIRVKASGAAGHSFAWDGTVVDAKDGLFLVNYTHREEWLTRDRIRVGNETSAITTQLSGPDDKPFAPPSLDAPKDGPGQAVNAKSKVKVGQRLIAYWGGRWLPVTVIEVSQTGVKIHWEGYTNGFDEVIDRARLRDVSEN